MRTASLSIAIAGLLCAAGCLGCQKQKSETAGPMGVEEAGADEKPDEKPETAGPMGVDEKPKQEKPKGPEESEDSDDEDL